MNDALLRWLGWAAVVLLLLGAVGSFFTRYRLLGDMLDRSQALLVQDDLLSSRPAGTPGFAPVGHSARLTSSGLTENCTGRQIQSLWLFQQTGGQLRAAVQVDGIPLGQLQCEAISVEASYRMQSRTGMDGLLLEMSFQRIR